MRGYCAIKGKRSPDSFHKELGKSCGITAAWPAQTRDCERRSLGFRSCARSSGTTSASSAGDEELNQALEKANRVSEFLELAELMCIDALHRTESCGGHFRLESQTPEGEAKRDDANFSYTAAWEWKGQVSTGTSQGTAHFYLCSSLPKELQMTMISHSSIWRQQHASAPGKFVTYQVKDVTPDMSFLEMLDALNEDLLSRGKPPLPSSTTAGRDLRLVRLPDQRHAHGGQRGTTVASFRCASSKMATRSRSSRGAPSLSGDPGSVVNRSAFDRIIQAGGFISAPTGSAPDANAILVPKEAADTAFDAAACIGCGACVAACPNAAAMLFTAAKVTHLSSLPQGQPERDQRT